MIRYLLAWCVVSTAFLLCVRAFPESEASKLTQLIKGPGGFAIDSKGNAMYDDNLWATPKDKDSEGGTTFTSKLIESSDPVKRSRVRLAFSKKILSRVSNEDSWGFDAWASTVNDGKVSSLTACDHYDNTCVTTTQELCSKLAKEMNANSSTELAEKLDACYGVSQIAVWADGMYAGLKARLLAAEGDNLAELSKISTRQGERVKRSETTSKALFNPKTNQFTHGIQLNLIGKVCKSMGWGPETEASATARKLETHMVPVDPK